MSRLRVALAGTGRLGVSLFKGVLESNHDVVAVIQNGRANTGAVRWINAMGSVLFSNSLSVVGLARRVGAPVFWIDTMDETELAPIRATRPDILLVGGFSIIFKKPMLEVPVIGCVNTHSSLLPKHRGPNPFSAAIIDGDPETAVTFHVMTEGIDDGDILSQIRVPIEIREDSGSLYKRTSEIAGEHVGDVLDGIAARGLQGIPQDHTLATYEKKLKPEQCEIDWSKSAVEIERLVRGCYPLSPLARFKHRGRCVYVTQVRASTKRHDVAPGTVVNLRPLTISTGDGSIVFQKTFMSSPLPWVWPAPWAKPRVGEELK
jgi:methionyl-tRNA formyltransferase